jgi:hypothetical protein
MRWSQWRLRPPVKEAAAPRVIAAVGAVLGTLGADPDGECWVVWGNDAMIKWSMFMPTPAGLVALSVRPASQDGPRVSGKVVRWSRLQVGEFSVEYQAGHRVVGVSVEGVVLQGADAEADEIGAFLNSIYAAIDGRAATSAAAPAALSKRVGRGKGSPAASPPELEPVPVPPSVDADDEGDDYLALPSGLGGPSGGHTEQQSHAARPVAEPLPPAAPAAPPPPKTPPAPVPRPFVEHAAGPLSRRLAAGVPAPNAPRTPGRPGSAG